MKTWIRIEVTVLVLMAGSGCVILKPDEDQNEVVSCIRQHESGGEDITCIEQISSSTDKVPNVYDVYVKSHSVVQVYRIVNRKVLNCRWSDCIHDESKGTHREHESYRNMLTALWEAIRQLPNRLEQNNTHCSPWETNSAATVTTMGRISGIPASDQSGFVIWYFWTVRQWRGATNDVPAAIEAFQQDIAQGLSKPEYVKHYRSYLRAVPLFTEADIEATKDMPLIDLTKTRYHVQHAIRHPYMLFPVPERRSPFPAVQGYLPGDTFRVSRDLNCAKPQYFLIETFAGEPVRINK